MNRCIFEIAVYRCSKQKHSEEAVARVERESSSATGGLELWLERQGVDPGVIANSKKRIRQHLEDKYFLPWHYNQAVGWLRLYIQRGAGSVIKAELYWHRGRRIRLDTKRKEFAFDNWHEIEVWPEESASSNEIYCEIRSALLSLSKEKKYKKRFIDLEAFDSIGPYVDWRSLLWGDAADSRSST